MLLGVRAVIAQSFERIHRANLIGMGVLPLQFMEGESASSLGLTGDYSYTINGVADTVEPGSTLTVSGKSDMDGSVIRFSVLTRVDASIEAEYYRHGGLLPYVLRQMLAEE